MNPIFQERRERFARWKRKEIFYMTFSFYEEELDAAISLCVKRHSSFIFVTLIKAMKPGTRINLTQLKKVLEMDSNNANVMLNGLKKQGIVKRVGYAMYERTNKKYHYDEL